jgi:hypothetical protein
MTSHGPNWLALGFTHFIVPPFCLRALLLRASLILGLAAWLGGLAAWRLGGLAGGRLGGLAAWLGLAAWRLGGLADVAWRAWWA